MDNEEFPDRKYLKRLDKGSEHRWQFQFERDPIKESKSFSDSKYGSKILSYQAARDYREEFLSSAFDLGILDPNDPSLRHSIPLVLALSPRNTSGIVGVSREHRERKDRKNPEVNWIANYQDETGKNKQKSFPITRLGEKEALLRAVTFRREFVLRVAQGTTNSIKREYIDKHLQELDSLLEYIAALEEDADVFFFLGTINNPLLSSTTKQEMLNVRIGQQRFRKLVLDMWGHKCAINGAGQFITASHIKPWSVSDNSERLDPFNGLALSPVYDKAFDVGLISFDDEGKILISKRLGKDAALLGITGQERIKELSFLHKKYLSYHRQERFRPGE